MMTRLLVSIYCMVVQSEKPLLLKHQCKLVISGKLYKYKLTKKCTTRPTYNKKRVKLQHSVLQKKNSYDLDEA